MTALKRRVRVIQVNWKWHHSIDGIWFPILASYSRLTIATSCIVSEIKRYIGWKSIFHTPPAFDVTTTLRTPSEFHRNIAFWKIRMVGGTTTCTVWKSLRIYFTYFATIHERDKQTDGQMDITSPSYSIAPARSVGLSVVSTYHCTFAV